MMRPSALVLAGVVLTVSACTAEEPKADTQSESKAKPKKKKKPKPKPIPLAELSKLVETQEDFEAQAVEEITADQLEAAITALEQEFESEPE